MILKEIIRVFLTHLGFSFQFNNVFYVLGYVLQQIFLIDSETKQKFREWVEGFSEN